MGHLEAGEDVNGILAFMYAASKYHILISHPGRAGTQPRLCSPQKSSLHVAEQTWLVQSLTLKISAVRHEASTRTSTAPGGEEDRW